MVRRLSTSLLFSTCLLAQNAVVRGPGTVASGYIPAYNGTSGFSLTTGYPISNASGNNTIMETNSSGKNVFLTDISNTGTFSSTNALVNLIYGTPTSWYTDFDTAYKNIFGAQEYQSDGINILFINPSSNSTGGPTGGASSPAALGVTAVNLCSTCSAIGYLSASGMGVNGSGAWAGVFQASNGSVLNLVLDGQTQASGSTSLTLDSSASTTPNIYNGYTLVARSLSSSPSAGGNFTISKGTITSYSAGRVATLSGGWSNGTPAPTSQYSLFSSTSNMFTGGGMVGLEVDVSNVYDLSGTNGMIGVLAFGGTRAPGNGGNPGNGGQAFEASRLDGGISGTLKATSGFTSIPWGSAFYSDIGAASIGLFLAPKGPCVNNSSGICANADGQPIWMVSSDSNGCFVFSTWGMDQTYNINFFPNTFNGGGSACSGQTSADGYIRMDANAGLDLFGGNLILGNGYGGTPGYLQLGARSVGLDPGCTGGGDLGKLWLNTSTSFTDLKICSYYSSVLGWRSIQIN